MPSPPPLSNNTIYHIYNRGNNKENLFKEARNYDYFMKLYDHYVSPIATTYAFCLLRNHFHLLVKIKTSPNYKPSKSFSNLFSTYTKAINKAYGRVGSLFQRPFRRKTVTNTDYFLHLITYIHRNPQQHGLTEDFRSWPYSSYHHWLNHKNFVSYLELFNGLDNFKASHQKFNPFNELIIESISGY